MKTGCNLDVMVIESYIHLITSKLDQNIIQKLDQQNKTYKKRITV